MEVRAVVGVLAADGADGLAPRHAGGELHLRGLEVGSFGFGCDGKDLWGTKQQPTDDEIRAKLATPNAERPWFIRYAFKSGMTIGEVHELTAIDPWFLDHLHQIVELEDELRAAGDLARIDDALFKRAKQFGFSDRQLATLLRSGIPLAQSLGALIEQVEHRDIEAVVRDLREQVVRGKSFAEALALHPKLFDELFVNMVKAGEASGNLDQVLTRLADYRVKQDRINARIKTALDTAARNEIDPSVEAAIKAAQASPPPQLARDNWRTFQVIDPSANDAAVRQEPYFVHAPDGIVWASYTDARGELNSEHVPAGTDKEHVRPASREAEY